jgi:GcrA cell cycle regulator
MSWTEERVEILTKLWQEGLSASQVAAEMGGISRNAVIGKVHRLGLSGRGQPATTKRQRRPRPLAEESRAVRPCAVGAAALRMEVRTLPQPAPRARENVVVPIAKRLPIEKLTERTCKWPIGDPGHSDFHFCGHDAQGSLPYCDYHARVAYHCADPGRRAKKAALA